jgi:DNA mismatch endonuclease (patch repair protein)
LGRKKEKNIARDNVINFQFNELGWVVLRFWDFEIKKNLDECILKTIETIKNSSSNL